MEADYADSMDEVIKLVTEKANISPEQARIAVQTVLDFLKRSGFCPKRRPALRQTLIKTAAP